MPKNFPGVNGGPTDGIPSFVCLDGLPVDWHHLVTQSKPLARAIHHAVLLPHPRATSTPQEQFEQIGLAELAAAERRHDHPEDRSWSRANLEPEPEPTPTPSRKH